MRMEHLLNASLSGSQLDLVIHGPDDPIAPGHCRPDQYRNTNQAFLDVESGRNDDNNGTLKRRNGGGGGDDDDTRPVSL